MIFDTWQFYNRQIWSVKDNYFYKFRLLQNLSNDLDFSFNISRPQYNILDGRLLEYEFKKGNIFIKLRVLVNQYYALYYNKTMLHNTLINYFIFIFILCNAIKSYTLIIFSLQKIVRFDHVHVLFCNWENKDFFKHILHLWICLLFSPRTSKEMSYAGWTVWPRGFLLIYCMKSWICSKHKSNL